jgi:hypothetical protein
MTPLERRSAIYDADACLRESRLDPMARRAFEKLSAVAFSLRAALERMDAARVE